MFSTAVTQAPEAFLIRAFKHTANGEFFRVVERVGLDNLTKERQLIRSAREQFASDEEKEKKLSPLLFAGVLLEGAVISYESNLETGGIGARALGIGIQDEYRRDMVSVALRLISVQTGEVLIAVSSQKTILSTKVGMNVFKFLDVSYGVKVIC